MNAEPLVKAIISAMLLLEHCGPDEVDPDTAARGLENMAYELLRLTDGHRREFVDVLGKIASETEYAPEAEFIRSIPFMIGMVLCRAVALIIRYRGPSQLKAVQGVPGQRIARSGARIGSRESNHGPHQVQCHGLLRYVPRHDADEGCPDAGAKVPNSVSTSST